MTKAISDTTLSLIAKHLIRVQPVVQKYGRGMKVLHWSAGYTQLGSDGWTNVIQNSADGATPEEAVANLVAGKLTIRANRLVKRPS